MVVKIAVLGAGINGLACALRIKERYKDYQVVVIAREFCPDTTADGSGGLWYPYLVGNTPEHLLAKWGAETYTLLHKLWLEGGYGICFVPCFNLYADAKNYQKPSWSDAVFSFRVLDIEYLKFLSELYNTKFEAGQAFSSFVTTTTPFLTQLTNQFKSLNGLMLQATVKSLDDPILDSFDIVVNCMGLGAKDVVPDNRVHAIRGQVSRVIAPWINACVFDGAGHYILPNEHTCVLGGTHQVNDYNRNLDNQDTEFVMKGCQTIMPTLKHAKLYSQWVGLRPARDEVRLEAERRGGKLFIHNYGHGGSGLTLFWGCATDVLHLLDKHYIHNVSKL